MPVEGLVGRPVVASAKLLRRLHDATVASDVAGYGEVVCHNDYGPWNLIWRDALPVAIIDFDNVSPGRRLDDVAYALWKHLNLGLIELQPREQGRRLRVMTRGYGVDLDDAVLEAIAAAQDRMREIIEEAPPGVGRDQALAQNDLERQWFSANSPLLRD